MEVTSSSDHRPPGGAVMIDSRLIVRLLYDEVAEVRVVVREVSELVAARVDLQHGTVDRGQANRCPGECRVEILGPPGIGLRHTQKQQSTKINSIRLCSFNVSRASSLGRTK